MMEGTDFCIMCVFFVLFVLSYLLFCRLLFDLNKLRWQKYAKQSKTTHFESPHTHTHI
jgi:hypothetical protein